MTIALLIIQFLFIVLLFIETIIIHQNRLHFESLILKFVNLCQGLYNRIEMNDKKLNDSVSSLSKTISSLLAVKNDIDSLKGIVKELQGISKYLKTGKLKEFKDIEDEIKKLKSQLKQEK